MTEAQSSGCQPGWLPPVGVPQPTWVVPVQHGGLVLDEEALCAGTDEVQGGDGPHERTNVTQPVLVGRLLGRGEATCVRHTARGSLRVIGVQGLGLQDESHKPYTQRLVAL